MMKNSISNFVISLFIGALIIAFPSCKKDKKAKKSNSKSTSSVISGSKVIDASSEISKVKIIGFWEDMYDWYEDVLAESDFENKSFTLTLPLVLSDRYLEDFEFDSNFTISNENARFFLIESVLAFDSDDNRIGDIFLEYMEDEKEYYTSWMYVDRNVIVEGEYIDELYDEKVTINLNLKKGWNMIYESYKEGATKVSSSKPADIDYRWEYYGY